MSDNNYLDWRGRAACRGLDPELFYPATGKSATPARTICDTCPVRAECAEWALDEGVERHGVWGGLTARDRRTVRRSRHITTTTIEAGPTTASTRGTEVSS